MENNTTDTPQPENNTTVMPGNMPAQTPDSNNAAADNGSKDLASFQIGTADLNGYKITKIYARTDEIVIYEIETPDLVDSIRICIDDSQEPGKTAWSRYNEIRVSFIDIKSYLYKAVDKASAKSKIAQILMHGIYSDPKDANNEFRDFIKEVNKEYYDQFNNKFFMLLSSIVVSIVMIIASLLFHYNENWFASDPHIRNLVFVCTASSIGGFFSISIGSRKLVCEKDVGWFLYFRYGMERMLISVFAATILYIGLRSEFLMLSVKNSLSSYMMLAFAAGFSETFIPGLFTRLEQEKLKNT